MNLHFGDSGWKVLGAGETQGAGAVSRALDTPHPRRALGLLRGWEGVSVREERRVLSPSSRFSGQKDGPLVGQAELSRTGRGGGSGEGHRLGLRCQHLAVTEVRV